MLYGQVCASLGKIPQPRQTMIIGVTNQKGGTGKTTTAVTLAYWLFRECGKSVLLIDADAQKSSSRWAAYLGIPTEVMDNPHDFFDRVPGWAKTVDFVVVDGPGSLSEMTGSILNRSDLVLIPCQPTELDVSSTSDTARQVRHSQEMRGGQPEAHMFLSNGRKKSVLLRESKEALKQAFPGIHLIDTVIHNRQCIADAPGQETVIWQMRGRSAQEAIAEYKELFSQLPLKFKVVPHASSEVRS